MVWFVCPEPRTLLWDTFLVAILNLSQNFHLTNKETELREAKLLDWQHTAGVHLPILTYFSPAAASCSVCLCPTLSQLAGVCWEMFKHRLTERKIRTLIYIASSPLP